MAPLRVSVPVPSLVTEPLPEMMEMADADLPAPAVTPNMKPSASQMPAHLIEAKLSHVETRRAASQIGVAAASESAPAKTNGTAVVSLGGGVLVPSLVGKPMRAALEIAQESGIDIDVIGSGVAREQSPPAGFVSSSGT